MRLKLTLLLAILNLIAFGAIYYLENGQNDAPKRQLSEPVLPSSITASDRIEISGKAIPERRVLTRKDESWRLEEPLVWRANPNAVDRIFRSLLFLRNDIRFTMDDIERNNQSLADYGLDSPILEISFLRGDRSTTVKIGSPTDVGSRFYLLGPSGREVFVVDEEILRSVALDLQDLRSPNLFAMDFFAIKEITLQPGNGRNLQIRLAAIEDGWQFEAPIQTRASAPAVDSRLQRILETPVLSLQPESQIPPNESGLIEPRLRLSLEEGGTRQTFLLGKTVPGEPDLAYGKIEGLPTVVTVSQESFLALEDAQTSLREKSFFLFRLPLVTSLQISSDQRIITLQRLEDKSWQVSASGPGIEDVRYSADSGVITNTFQELITLRALRFVSDAPSDTDLRKFGLDTPQRIVEVIGEQNHRLLLGDLDPETRTLYAKVGDAPFVYTVPLQIIRELPVSPLAYRNRLLDQIPETASITSVKVIDLETGDILLDREMGEGGKSWTAGLLDERSETADTSFVSILRQLRNFRVESYLSPTFTPGLQIDEERTIPWRYRLEATVLLPGSGETSKETIGYSLTERIEGTLQGGGSDKKGVTFILPQDFIDAWNDLFATRELPEEYDEAAAAEAAAKSEHTWETMDETDPAPITTPEGALEVTSEKNAEPAIPEEDVSGDSSDTLSDPTSTD